MAAERAPLTELETPVLRHAWSGRTFLANMDPTTAVYVLSWYVLSGCTLFLNKYLLSSLGVQPTVLGMAQMLSTTVYGAALQARTINRDLFTKHDNFARDIMLVGGMRFATVLLGLLSLAYIPVSFTETVKASAPLFTVLFARFLLSESTPAPVVRALVPVAGGLAMASAAELEFNLIGFSAACLTNSVDCVQNVFAKKLLTASYSAQELQFYTSLAAMVVQVPLWGLQWTLAPESSIFPEFTPHVVTCLLLDGLAFHCQSMAAYAVMTQVSPVTHSVINTAKRAILIWVSVLLFGNAVSLISGVGTVVCVAGVFWYNGVRNAMAAKAADPRGTWRKV